LFVFVSVFIFLFFLVSSFVNVSYVVIPVCINICFGFCFCPFFFLLFVFVFVILCLIIFFFFVEQLESQGELEMRLSKEVYREYVKYGALDFAKEAQLLAMRNARNVKRQYTKGSVMVVVTMRDCNWGQCI